MWAGTQSEASVLKILPAECGRSSSVHNLKASLVLQLEVLIKEATICKCDLRCQLTALHVDFIFQGSIQEERARRLQEDLNASREKYEKSQEEVKTMVMKVIFLSFIAIHIIY